MIHARKIDLNSDWWSESLLPILVHVVDVMYVLSVVRADQEYYMNMCVGQGVSLICSGCSTVHGWYYMQKVLPYWY